MQVFYSQINQIKQKSFLWAQNCSLQKMRQHGKSFLQEAEN